MNLPRHATLSLRTAVSCSGLRAIILSLILLCGPSALSQPDPYKPARDVLGMSLESAIALIASAPTPAQKAERADSFVACLRSYGFPLMEDSTVCFVYSGKARRVAVPSDLNGWNPSADTMVRINGTSFFYRMISLDPATRIEYKLLVDTVWILDPLNRQVAMGGYGKNSELWMPRYKPSRDIDERAGVPRGRIDTLMFASKILGRTHPVMVYLPPGCNPESGPYPTIDVMDGGEYLSLGRMNIVLDNLIAEKRIRPVIGVFMDPRTDPRDSRTSKRMEDYAMSQSFVRCLAEELIPFIRQKYPVTTDPRQTAILGASLGGLIGTYAAATRPDVFGLCAAQSSAYQFLNDSIYSAIPSSPAVRARFYLGTGTLRDAREETIRMRDLLRSRGFEVLYQEVPEGHNWVHWRARLADILTYFWSAQ